MQEYLYHEEDVRSNNPQRDGFAATWERDFEVLLTVHLSIFISVINQLDVQSFCFTITLFHASTCFEHMCSKHVEA